MSIKCIFVLNYLFWSLIIQRVQNAGTCISHHSIDNLAQKKAIIYENQHRHIILTNSAAQRPAIMTRCRMHRFQIRILICRHMRSDFA
jgi:hypothetical protein